MVGFGSPPAGLEDPKKRDAALPACLPGASLDQPSQPMLARDVFRELWTPRGCSPPLVTLARVGDNTLGAAAGVGLRRGDAIRERWDGLACGHWPMDRTSPSNSFLYLMAGAQFPPTFGPPRQAVLRFPFFGQKGGFWLDLLFQRPITPS